MKISHRKTDETAVPQKETIPKKASIVEIIKKNHNSNAKKGKKTSV